MYYTFQQRLAHVVLTILAWAFAYSIFGVIRLYGIDELPHIASVGTLDLNAFILQLLLAAVITGILYGSVDIILDRPEIQRLPYGVILSTRIILHILTVLAVLVVLIYSRVRLGIVREGYFDSGMPVMPGRIIFNKSFYVFVMFFGIVISILDFYQQVKHKFGRGVFFDMLLGRYHKPKESERIFMFIDLRSSVSLAEQLGHILYSNLLQDCFFDLNTQLNRYDAKVHQYVGDQVVLHWKLKNGLRRYNCVHCFFGFLDRLEKRKAYYLNRYGLVPYFKAGAHTGRATVAEVGLHKRELAFHGDTVNSTSRIHDFCNKYNQRMLISKNLYDLVSGDRTLQFISIGDQVLKGKNKSMELFGVKRKSDESSIVASATSQETETKGKTKTGSLR
ncbi:MAG TPA: adenylate/guanylate cyclase domain-containing protein [Saprospiraceae bacterium]|nr:adenylate/guanylate cyclase domain-containing protein [Saprospiraceae bacterium]